MNLDERWRNPLGKMNYVTICMSMIALKRLALQINNKSVINSLILQLLYIILCVLWLLL